MLRHWEFWVEKTNIQSFGFTKLQQREGEKPAGSVWKSNYRCCKIYFQHKLLLSSAPKNPEGTVSYSTKAAVHSLKDTLICGHSTVHLLNVTIFTIIKHIFLNTIVLIYKLLSK